MLDDDANGDNDLLDKDMIQNLKTTITTKLNQCRILIRQHCSMDKIKNQYETCLTNDRVGTLGFTTGAVAALVL
jgi:hypothetical protein